MLRLLSTTFLVISIVCQIAFSLYYSRLIYQENTRLASLQEKINIVSLEKDTLEQQYYRSVSLDNLTKYTNNLQPIKQEIQISTP